MNLTELVKQYILPTGRSCFLISWEAELEGMVILQQIKKILALAGQSPLRRIF